MWLADDTRTEDPAPSAGVPSLAAKRTASSASNEMTSHYPAHAPRSPSSEVAALRDDLRALRSELDRQDADAPQHEQVNARGAAPPEPDAERIVGAEQAWTEDYSTQLEDTLFEQATDRAWVQETRTQAETTFGTRLPDSDVGDTACGSTLCRLEITHRTPLGHEDLLASVRDEFPWAGAALIVPTTHETGHSTRIYLAKEGSELPSPRMTVEDFVEEH
jgi:hypothetical protein